MSFIGDRSKQYKLGSTMTDKNNNGVIDLNKLYEKIKKRNRCKYFNTCELAQEGNHTCEHQEEAKHYCGKYRETEWQEKHK